MEAGSTDANWPGALRFPTERPYGRKGRTEQAAQCPGRTSSLTGRPNLSAADRDTAYKPAMRTVGLVAGEMVGRAEAGPACGSFPPPRAA